RGGGGPCGRSDIELQRLGEGSGVRRILLEGGQREIAESPGRIRAKQLRTAVDGVHRLTPFNPAWPRSRRSAIAAPEGGGNRGECARAERRGHGRHGVI